MEGQRNGRQDAGPGDLRRRGGRERICQELTSGKAAAGVLTPFNEASMISAKLGGASEEHTVSDEDLKAGQ